jgi:2-desacetyl-2-hydroxyethyl bacteriochlorophyllide A dehydrogenase
MKAMVLEQFKQPMVWRDVPDPECGAQDVVIRVRANGLCATDLKVSDGAVSTVKLPLIPGHEVAGEVVEVGQDAVGLKPGDHIAVFPAHGCGSCDACRTGAENICRHVLRTGFELDGGFSEYMRVRAKNAIKVGSGVPFDEASTINGAISTGYHALVQKARARAGETVLIIGVGGLGIHMAQIAKVMGATVFAADIDPEKLRLAEDYGADAVINSQEQNLPEAIKDLTGGDGVDIVAECVGGHAVSGILDDSIACLKVGGRLLVVGYAYGQSLKIDSAALIYGQWSLIGTRASTIQDDVEVARLVESGQLKPVLSQRFPLEQANEALEQLSKSSPIGRMVLTS